MMEAVTTIPPFEHFYTEHREAVFGFLARRLGRAAAEDAFQETFLRALRAYERLEHGLPPAERAAVVLRYGYDLPYAEIGAALGSSADAARQAASSGIRRLRRKDGLT